MDVRTWGGVGSHPQFNFLWVRSHVIQRRLASQFEEQKWCTLGTGGGMGESGLCCLSYWGAVGQALQADSTPCLSQKQRGGSICELTKWDALRARELVLDHPVLGLRFILFLVRVWIGRFDPHSSTSRRGHKLFTTRRWVGKAFGLHWFELPRKDRERT
jgi:hypothetical protein